MRMTRKNLAAAKASVKEREEARIAKLRAKEEAITAEQRRMIASYAEGIISLDHEPDVLAGAFIYLSEMLGRDSMVAKFRERGEAFFRQRAEGRKGKKVAVAGEPAPGNEGEGGGQNQAA